MSYYGFKIGDMVRFKTEEEMLAEGYEQSRPTGDFRTERTRYTRFMYNNFPKSGVYRIEEIISTGRILLEPFLDHITCIEMVKPAGTYVKPNGIREISQ